MFEVNKETYEALQKRHPAEAMILEKLIADGDARLTDGPTRSE